MNEPCGGFRLLSLSKGSASQKPSAVSAGAAVRVRQIHTKVMEPDLLACDVAIRFAKIRLGGTSQRFQQAKPVGMARGGVTRTMAQRHEHLAGAQRCLRHILTHNRIPAGKSIPRIQTDRGQRVKSDGCRKLSTARDNSGLSVFIRTACGVIVRVGSQGR